MTGRTLDAVALEFKLYALQPCRCSVSRCLGDRLAPIQHAASGAPACPVLPGTADSWAIPFFSSLVSLTWRIFPLKLPLEIL
jgi:hypothetical protein